MGSTPKIPKIEPVPMAAPPVKPEDESVKASGKNERRRIAALMGRKKTVTSQRGNSILG